MGGGQPIDTCRHARVGRRVGKRGAGVRLPTDGGAGAAFSIACVGPAGIRHGDGGGGRKGQCDHAGCSTQESSEDKNYSGKAKRSQGQTEKEEKYQGRLKS